MIRSVSLLQESPALVQAKTLAAIEHGAASKLKHVENGERWTEIVSSRASPPPLPPCCPSLAAPAGSGLTEAQKAAYLEDQKEKGELPRSSLFRGFSPLSFETVH